MEPWTLGRCRNRQTSYNEFECVNITRSGELSENCRLADLETLPSYNASDMSISGDGRLADLETLPSYNASDMPISGDGRLANLDEDSPGGVCLVESLL